MSSAQDFFHVVAQLAANAFQIARNARFVLAEPAADFRQGMLLDVIEAEALSIARVEQTEGYLDGAGEQRQISLAIGIRGCGRARAVTGIAVVDCHGVALLVGQRSQAGTGAEGVHMALGQDGAKPGLQGTASVKVAKKGANRALSVGQAVQIREKRVCQFVSIRGSRRAAENRACGGSEVRLVSCNEVLPGGHTALGASRGQREVLNMQ